MRMKLGGLVDLHTNKPKFGGGQEESTHTLAQMNNRFDLIESCRLHCYVVGIKIANAKRAIIFFMVAY